MGEAKPMALDGDQRNPLHEACQEGSIEVAKVLLDEANKNFGQSAVFEMIYGKDDDGASPLLLGVGKGGTGIVDSGKRLCSTIWAGLAFSTHTTFNLYMGSIVGNIHQKGNTRGRR